MHSLGEGLSLRRGDSYPRCSLRWGPSRIFYPETRCRGSDRRKRTARTRRETRGPPLSMSTSVNLSALRMANVPTQPGWDTEA